MTYLRLLYENLLKPSITSTSYLDETQLFNFSTVVHMARYTLSNCNEAISQKLTETQYEKEKEDKNQATGFYQQNLVSTSHHEKLAYSTVLTLAISSELFHSVITKTFCNSGIVCVVPLMKAVTIWTGICNIFIVTGDCFIWYSPISQGHLAFDNWHKQPK